MRITGLLASLLSVSVAVSAGCKKDQTSSRTEKDVAAEDSPKGTRNEPTNDAEARDDKKRDEWIRKLVRAFDFQKALAIEFETSATNVHGREGKTNGAGVFSILRTPGPTYRRVHMNNLHILPQDDNKQIGIEERLLWVTDGETLTHYGAVKTQAETTRSPYRHADMLQFGGRELFDIIQEHHVLEFKSEDTLYNRPVVVFDAMPKHGKGRLRHWFDIETGVRLRYKEWDASGELYFEMQSMQLEMEPEFPEDWFHPVLPDPNDSQ